MNNSKGLSSYTFLNVDTLSNYERKFYNLLYTITTLKTLLNSLKFQTYYQSIFQPKQSHYLFSTILNIKNTAIHLNLSLTKHTKFQIIFLYESFKLFFIFILNIHFSTISTIVSTFLTTPPSELYLQNHLQKKNSTKNFRTTSFILLLLENSFFSLLSLARFPPPPNHSHASPLLSNLFFCSHFHPHNKSLLSVLTTAQPIEFIEFDSIDYSFFVFSIIDIFIHIKTTFSSLPFFIGELKMSDTTENPPGTQTSLFASYLVFSDCSRRRRMD